MQWSNAGFAALLPDLAPIVVQPEQLAQQVPASTYRQLKTSINGKHSLRELAVLTKRETIEVARSLLPFLRQKLIKLVEVPDLKIPQNPLAKSKKASPRSLIACIDDSKRVCEALEGIVSKAGYECLTVQNPLQALPLLIQRKPNLIFLDLTMPTINGYELCSQIRRLPGFQETPVVILTSSDRIVDRVRAKMVGATDFITKPVDAKKVTAAARRHLKAQTVAAP
nr:response regulator [Oscillatoria sp. FACHB-1406]